MGVILHGGTGKRGNIRRIVTIAYQPRFYARGTEGGEKPRYFVDSGAAEPTIFRRHLPSQGEYMKKPAARNRLPTIPDRPPVLF